MVVLLICIFIGWLLALHVLPIVLKRHRVYNMIIVVINVEEITLECVI
jgi:hypothetical protein